MQQYFETLQDQSGNAIALDGTGTVTVTAFPGGGAAAIYSTNSTASPIAGSVVTADITGQVSFFAPDGAYILNYALNASVYKTKTPVQILDPMGFVTATDLGTAGAYVVTSSSYPLSLFAGLKVQFKAANTSGVTAPTFNLNATGAIAIVNPDGSAVGQVGIVSGGLYRLEYDGTRWQLLSPSSVFNQQPTHQQFANAGAQIQRVNDRLMVGDACVNDGQFPNVTKDWLSAFQIAQAGGPANGTLIGVQMAVLGDHLVPGLGAFLAGAEALNCTVPANIVITGSFFSVNNPSSGAVAAQTWALYGEAHRMNNTTNTAIACELDVVERGAALQFQPYATGAVGTIGYISAAGAGLSAAGQFNATAAYVIGSNPMAFNKGIVFQAKSIAGTDGVTGSGYAIAMAKGHVVSWWATGGVQTGTIVGTGTTNANAVGLVLGEATLSVLVGGVNQTLFQGNPAGVNYLTVFNSATGIPVALKATGGDTNLDLEFLASGSGTVRFGSSGMFTANGAVATVLGSLGPPGSNTTVQEWFTIKDAATGAVRFIPCF